jgi:Meiotically up-regulated gene 113
MPVSKIKKHTVAHDELLLRDGGLYCFLPFERLTKKNAVFKVGMTSQSLNKRLEQYHSAFPLGVYIVFYLSYPRIKRGQDKDKLYRDMERKLISNLKETKAKMLIFPSRPNQRSEWFYTNFNDLQTAFRQVQAEYGGILHEYSLDEIDAQYETTMKSRGKKYVGEIIFKV